MGATFKSRNSRGAHLDALLSCLRVCMHVVCTYIHAYMHAYVRHSHTASILSLHRFVKLTFGEKQCRIETTCGPSDDSFCYD